jgi:hypothetical protein
VEARSAALVVLGTVPWLVLAGLIEGFVSRTGTGWVPATIIGIVVGGGFWFMVWKFGRSPTEPSPGQSRARAFALK